MNVVPVGVYRSVSDERGREPEATVKVPVERPTEATNPAVEAAEDVCSGMGGSCSGCEDADGRAGADEDAVDAAAFPDVED